MQIEAIARQTTADLVVERIAQVIKERKLSAGERLPGEHELVEQLRVSRPVLREALARLQSMGLIEIQRGRGTFVGNATSLANCVRLLRSAVTISPQELRSYACTSFGDRSAGSATSCGKGDRPRHCGTCRLRETTR